mmetsp:Transcript_31692/g.70450  ORF Transcript_31692/g.70450 Transcript_31692/m.70450 type:complete len:365 (-) Transcript_31692:731-1825(-)|eukprot:CAMPEP_0202893794 /NCGR_PEP_ID=MMETSP1392-20130828/3302_1 /ASSEMBLY_ACC=CAM_ASM_000868 /TAXON_ID=225041 /ORGANISM="Chlamydomonas chlamydogama, Strain SAG 11-48b" /LENGTH=364 /DNA_ID=CAMNT_0049578251 /DNA_START=119 /DNA_END=1213 /DNA_ORIENTATION=-
MTNNPPDTGFEHVGHEQQNSDGGSGQTTSFEEVEYVEETVYEDIHEGTSGAESRQLDTPNTSSPTKDVAEHELAEDKAHDHDNRHTPDEHPASSAPADAEKESHTHDEAEEEVEEVEEMVEEEGSAGPAEDEGADAQEGAPESSTGAQASDVDFKQLEAQAAKVAKEVSQVALDVSSKLTAGFKSALGNLSAPDTASLTKLAGGLSSWWSSLDPPAQKKNDEQAERVLASNKASSELQELFGLSAEENLVEQFKCKLLQTYACNHNNFTPAIQMAFQGTMYITDKHTCFSVEERGRKLPFKVPHTQVVKATRQRPQRKGDLSDILRLDTNMPGSSPGFLAFKDFDSGSALDSALALVEHLMEGA